jgi:hypothetical protein
MSNAGPPIGAALREVWFWSGVFRDHGQFIHDNLAPDQPNYIRWAQGFHQAFEQLHTEVKQLGQAASLPGPAGSYATGAPLAEAPLTGLQGQELIRYEQQAQQLSGALLERLGSLKAFKEELLQQKLDCKVKLALGPSLLSHMIIEAEEAQRALGAARSLEQLPPPLQALHHHLIWLPDAAGHAAALHGGLDGSERRLLNATAEFRQIFSGMQIQALELYGMLRVAPRMVGALRRLNRDAMTQIGTFRAFLVELREHLEGCEVLGTLVPLFADHMLREELYYTEKMMALDGAP